MSPPAIPPDADELLASVRDLHEDIRAAVSECLDRARRTGSPELASGLRGWAAGDLSFAIDEVAEGPLAAFGERLAVRGPARLVAEGPGERRFGGSEGPALAALVDPVDGTRGLMHDMRSAWAVTGLAPDKGQQTRLSDVVLAVQTELPTTTAAVYHVLTAVRGRGATLARHDVTTGECLESGPLEVSQEQPLANGFYAFTRYLPAERPHVTRLELAFLQRLVERHGVDPLLLYDDVYLASAGQLFLTVTGRYRMLADLRAWLGDLLDLPSFTVKPYDVGALLVFTEAGLPVLDGSGAPLDGPFDTSTPLNVVAFGNESLRATLLPLLEEARAELLAGA